MARPGLTAHPKFRRLAHALQLPTPYALGLLECLWSVAYESGRAEIGDETDIELAAQWPGEPGVLCRALLIAGGEGRAGFIESTADDPCRFEVHDLMHHAPDYVRKRREREDARHVARRCATCATEYRSTRSDSQYCSAACRMRAHRNRNEGQPSGSGDASVTATVMDDAQRADNENHEAQQCGSSRETSEYRADCNAQHNGSVAHRESNVTATVAIVAQRDGSVAQRDSTPTPTPTPTPHIHSPLKPPRKNRGKRNTSADSPGFDRFVAEFPAGHRDGKVHALKLWVEKGLEIQTETVLAGLRAWKCSSRWAEGFIPSLKNFIGDEKWSDKPKQNAQHATNGIDDFETHLVNAPIGQGVRHV